MSLIERSRKFIEERYRWVIDESTFGVLDEDACVWAAFVTSKRYATPADPNFTERLAIIVTYQTPVVLYVESGATLALKAWVERNVK